MNNHHNLWQIQPQTPEQQGIQIVSLSQLMQAYLAQKRAHYLSMAHTPRDAGHKRFIMRELKVLDRLQQTQNGYQVQQAVNTSF